MAKVRLFGYAGIVQIEQKLVKQFSSSSVFMRQEPYLWSQVLTLNGAVPQESVVQANDKATMLVIEIDDNTQIRYELNPNGPSPASSHRDAGTNSPKLAGDNVFQWFVGATVSVVDAAAV